MSILFLTLARLLSIVIGVLLAPHLFAADITYCLVAKGRLYHQTNANEVATGPRPFVRHSIVNGNLAVGPTWVFAPNGIPASLSGTYSSRVQEQTLFARTSSALEQLSPNGTYRIEMATETEGRRTNRITLPAGVTYPNPPTIQNYTEAQNIDPASNFTLQWQPFINGTAGDLITLTIYGYPSVNSGPLYQTASFLSAPGKIDGTQTSFQIPSGTLAPGHTYIARLRYEKVVHTNLTEYPGAEGRGAFFSSTDFYLATVGAPKGPELLSAYPANGSQNVPRDTPLVWTFDRPMRRAFSLERSGTGSSTNRWSPDLFMIETRLHELLGPDEAHYTVLNRWGASLLMRDQNGDPLFPERYNTFRTGTATNTASAPAAPLLSIQKLVNTVEIAGDTTPGYGLMVQASTNLTNWSMLAFSGPTNSNITANDTNTLAHRFYRALVVP